MVRNRPLVWTLSLTTRMSHAENYGFFNAIQQIDILQFHQWINYN